MNNVKHDQHPELVGENLPAYREYRHERADEAGNLDEQVGEFGEAGREDIGVVGPTRGTKPRDLLITSMEEFDQLANA